MNQERIYQVLLGPHVSEKTTVVADAHGQYVFKIDTTATKREIKKAVETLFEVSVKSVQTVVIKGKTKVTRNRKGKRSDWKKAYVSLEQGQEIDFNSVE
ncbi:MAG: 50S ribosomal protein L23 [Candidatus Endonucleobacter bathymodioli]|uniref:Large ribosomal subunit protein uL23 n=1 Tax=Candidatus Endonucleibacter bathymodioli TaxID=539814 RepID=A0AA90NZL9_9GAMM|nr:50S ribosomal protein L23 [Candidatus Endonucleobacter bathymodioli]